MKGQKSEKEKNNTYVSTRNELVSHRLPQHILNQGHLLNKMTVNRPVVIKNKNVSEQS